MAKTPGLELIAEDELARLMQAGDQDARAEFVRRYEKRLFALMYRMVQDKEEARDLTQEALLRTLQKIHTYREMGRFTHWFLTLGRHVAADYLRKNRIETVSFESDEPVNHGDPPPREVAAPGETPSGEYRLKESVARIRKAAECLPEKYRTCFVARDVHDMDFREIARITGLKESSVREYVARARKEIQAMIKERGQGDEPESGGSESAVT